MTMESKQTTNTLSPGEIQLAKDCLAFAQQEGAQQVRITLSKSLMNLTGVLNGEVDKVAHALDRSLQLQVFADGKFGAFSSNRLEKEELKAFVQEAVRTVKMLEPDACRRLPDPERCVRDARDGKELELYDPAHETLCPEDRKRLALRSAAWPEKKRLEQGFTLIAEEGEYSDSVFDSLTIDSQGLYARHTETSFEIGYESTVEDAQGNHYSSFWWDASPRLKDLQWEGCARKACLRAAEQMGPKSIPGGKYSLIVDSECASKLLTPVLNALGGYSLQQNNSFLADSLGKQRFPEVLTIMDCPQVPGQTGCRRFDSEGVATREMPIIEKGVVRNCFINTYIAEKTGWAPTIEDATRVVLQPIGPCKSLDDLLAAVGDGILVTGFNGGNSNPATGNFSYGIEGFLIRNGKRVHPVREMLITGNFLQLWGDIFATADDARPCLTKSIPSLAFKNVDFSA